MYFLYFLLEGPTPESQLIKRMMENRASSWLSALAIEAIVYDYELNRQEFMDAICTRHGKGHTYPLYLWRDKLWITALYAGLQDFLHGLWPKS